MNYVSMETPEIPGDYICSNCGGYVKDPTVVIFHNSEYGADLHDPCPYCGEEGSLEEADYCECGNYKMKRNWCCEKCQKEAENKLGLFVRSLRKPQLAYMDDLLEGDGLESWR